MGKAEFFARQQGRHENNEKRPEVGNQPGLGRGREPQGGKIEGVIAKQATDTQEPNGPRLTEGGKAFAIQKNGHKADKPADEKCHRGKLEGRHGARPRRHQRKARPEQDRAEARQRRKTG